MPGWHPPLPAGAPFSAGAVWHRPQVAEVELGHLAAEVLAGHEVDHGVLTGEDPAEGGLVGGGLEAAEGPGYAGICVRANRQPLVVTIEGAQYGGRCLADRGVGTGVGGVGRGNRERVPAGVADDVRVTG